MKLSLSSLDILRILFQQGEDKLSQLYYELEMICKTYHLAVNGPPKHLRYDEKIYEVIYDQPFRVVLLFHKQNGELLSITHENIEITKDTRLCFPAEVSQETLLDYDDTYDDTPLYLWDQEEQTKYPISLLFRESIMKEDEFMIQPTDTLLRMPEYDFVDENNVSWKVLLIFHEKDTMLVYPCILSKEKGELHVIQAPMNIPDAIHFSVNNQELLYSTQEVTVYPTIRYWHHIPLLAEMFQE